MLNSVEAWWAGLCVDINSVMPNLFRHPISKVCDLMVSLSCGILKQVQDDFSPGRKKLSCGAPSKHGGRASALALRQAQSDKPTSLNIFIFGTK